MEISHCALLYYWVIRFPVFGDGVEVTHTEMRLRSLIVHKGGTPAFMVTTKLFCELTISSCWQMTIMSLDRPCNNDEIDTLCSDAYWFLHRRD